MHPGLVAGVDIGGTKTHLRVSRDGRVIVDRVVPTPDWRRRDNSADAGALLALVTDAAGSRLTAIGVGAHGCDTTEECAAFETALTALTPSRVRVVNDAELVVPAAGLREGIGVIAGTGSIAVARKADGAMLVAGGWGWIFGDEGSAPGLVREAARAVRNAIDLGEETDGLYDTLRRSTGAANFTEIGRELTRNRDAAAWGRHARAVFAAADAGSELAAQVIHDAARALVVLVERLVARGAHSRDVVVSGGVMVGQPTLQDLFRRELGRRLPAHRLSILTEPPVGGAVALAARLLETAAEAGEHGPPPLSAEQKGS